VGLIGGLALGIITSALPIAVIVGIDKSYSNYGEGYFTVVANQIGGNLLSWWVVVGAAVGSFGSFQTYLYATAITMKTLADHDYLNVPALSQMNRFNTAWVAIIVSAISAYVLSFMTFEELIQVSQSFYGICIIMQYGAIIRLRQTQPNLKRPFKIPLGIFGLVLLTLPHALISLGIIYVSATFSSRTMLIFSGVVLTGLISYRYRHIKPEE